MMDFPTATKIHKRLPKEAFYQHLSLSTVLKNKFISDVDRISIENSLTKETLNLSNDAEIKEILLLAITLKKQTFDAKIIETIARQNPHKLVFQLIFEDSAQLALYHGKLYRTPWLPANALSLTLKGYSLADIWDNLIEQIALYDERTNVPTEGSLDERLALKERISKLKKRIQKTEAALWKEQQPKKKFALHTELQAYKKELEELTNG